MTSGRSEKKGRHNTTLLKMSMRGLQERRHHCVLTFHQSVRPCALAWLASISRCCTASTIKRRPSISKTATSSSRSSIPAHERTPISSVIFEVSPGNRQGLQVLTPNSTAVLNVQTETRHAVKSYTTSIMLSDRQLRLNSYLKAETLVLINWHIDKSKPGRLLNKI